MVSLGYFLSGVRSDRDEFIFWNGQEGESADRAPVKWEARLEGGSKITRAKLEEVFGYAAKYSQKPLEVEAINYIYDCNGAAIGSLVGRWISIADNSATITFWGSDATMTDAFYAALVRVFGKLYPGHSPQEIILPRELRLLEDGLKEFEAPEVARENSSDYESSSSMSSTNGELGDPETLSSESGEHIELHRTHRWRSAAIEDMRKIMVGVAIALICAILFAYFGLR